jgi:hypothetical protein
MPVTKPAVIVATAVAGSPAKARPIESDINTATVISHPGTFITGKLPAFLGYRIPFGDCNGTKNRISCLEVGPEFKTWVPRGHAAGIRTLPTPTPLGTVWPQKRDPLLEQIVLGLEKITQPTVLALKANIVPNTEHSEAVQWKSV